MAAAMWRTAIVNTAKLVRGTYHLKACHGCFKKDSTLLKHLQSLNSNVNCRFLHLSNTNYCALNDDQVKKLMEKLTDKFAEARELMQDARESQGTVYFSEDMMDAQEAVKETLDEYDSLLSKLNETQKQNVVRTIGLRMEELKAQKDALEESLKD